MKVDVESVLEADHPWLRLPPAPGEYRITFRFEAVPHCDVGYRSAERDMRDALRGNSERPEFFFQEQVEHLAVSARDGWMCLDAPAGSAASSRFAASRAGDTLMSVRFAASGRGVLLSDVVAVARIFAALTRAISRARGAADAVGLVGAEILEIGDKALVDDVSASGSGSSDAIVAHVDEARVDGIEWAIAESAGGPLARAIAALARLFRPTVGPGAGALNEDRLRPRLQLVDG